MYDAFFTAVNASVILAGSAFVANMPAGDNPSHEKLHAAFVKCAIECNNCQRACDSCASHCIHMVAEGKKHHQRSLRTCQDCATHCSAAASIMARHGPFSDLICKACADACGRCAKECEMHKEDRQMKECAEACRKCEQACQQMLTHLAAHP